MGGHGPTRLGAPLRRHVSRPIGVPLVHHADSRARWALRIGVTLEEDRLDAHAWVEQDGAVVNDDPDIANRFAVFDGDPAGLVFA